MFGIVLLSFRFFNVVFYVKYDWILRLLCQRLLWQYLLCVLVLLLLFCSFSVTFVYLRARIVLGSFWVCFCCLGLIHKGCLHKFGNFWDLPLPLSRPVHIWLTPPSSCPWGHKAGIIWNIATCEQITLKGKKNWSFWYWMYTHVCSYYTISIIAFQWWG